MNAEMMSAKPDHYAVMGNPVAHSKSPQIHTLFARQTGQDLVYTAILVELGHFAEAVAGFAAAGGKGLNITVPFKREAWELVDERSPRAARAGAVNTILFRPEGGRYGDNTDGIGLVRDLRDNHGIRIQGRRVLLLGAGGAVRGVAGPLLEERPAQLVIANRTADKAVELAKELTDLGKVAGCGYQDLDAERFDLIINGTAASLKGEMPPLPATVLAAGGCCYDMMYGAQPTPFMRWAIEHGAQQALDGLGMLVEQAAEAFFLWRGVHPQTRPVVDALRAQLL
ncbi:MAG: shikimate dehydrogenase [Gammaproteobacteria bacterium]|nr:shikimate dehydrogenase [Gammaproteobacteria bacterium]